MDQIEKKKINDKKIGLIFSLPCATKSLVLSRNFFWIFIYRSISVQIAKKPKIIDLFEKGKGKRKVLVSLESNNNFYYYPLEITN